MKIIRFLVLLLTLSSCNPSILKNGDGSEQNPYLINNLQEFLDFAGRVYQNSELLQDKYFKLNCSLDLKNIDYIPIGYSLNTSFKGHFDGGNHTIKNVKIKDGYMYNGIFGIIDQNSSVKNLKVENITYTSINNGFEVYAGGIAGYSLYGSLIENCFVDGSFSLYQTDIIDNEYLSVYSSTFGGGIVGKSIGSISLCGTKVDITADIVGGLVGDFEGSYLTDSQVNQSNLYGSHGVGAICGYQNSLFDYQFIMENKVFSSTLKSNLHLGGVTGFGGGSNYIISNIINAKGSYQVKNKGGTIGSVIGFNKDNTNKFVENNLINMDLNIENEVMYTHFLTCGNDSLYVNAKNNLFFGRVEIKNSSLVKIYIKENNVASFKEDSNFPFEGSIFNEETILKALKISKDWLIIKEDNYDILSYEDVFTFLSGEGSKNVPYLIEDEEDFSYIYFAPNNTYFKIIKDLNFKNQNVKMFTYYYGYDNVYIEGDNHIINNFYLDEGLFEDFKHVTFNNVSFENGTANLDESILGTTNELILNNFRIDIEIESDRINSGDSMNFYTYSYNSEIVDLNDCVFNINITSFNYKERINFFPNVSNLNLKNNTINAEFDNLTKDIIIYLSEFDENAFIENNLINVKSDNHISYENMDINEGIILNSNA